MDAAIADWTWKNKNVCDTFNFNDNELKFGGSQESFPTKCLSANRFIVGQLLESPLSLSAKYAMNNWTDFKKTTITLAFNDGHQSQL